MERSSGARNPIRRRINRNLHGIDRLELWLVSAVITILAVRMILALTGYPQVGGSTSLHIAHVLWGGLLMAAGIIIMFSFLGSTTEALGIVAGGVGFGLFIDEVGKFVTKDNDYFFQPSVAIMYTVFVVIYLAGHWILTSRGYNSTEYLVNAITELREMPGGAGTAEEKRLIVYTLGKCDPGDPLVTSMRSLVGGIDTAGARGGGWFVSLRDRFHDRYRRLAGKRWFTRTVAGFFILQMVASALVVLTILFDIGSVIEQLDDFTFADWAILASDLLAGVFVTWGVLVLRRSRLEAYKLFERSLLVQIFIGQMFLFYKDEFSALPGFVFELLLLLAIRFMVQRERSELISASIETSGSMD